MQTSTNASGACPTLFRSLCQTASEGGPNSGYEWAGHGIIRHLWKLIEFDDEAERDAKLTELDGLVNGGSAYAFANGPNGSAVIEWFRRELPRCIGLVPPRRHGQFLRGIYCYVVEEGNSITEW